MFGRGSGFLRCLCQRIYSCGLGHVAVRTGASYVLGQRSRVFSGVGRLGVPMAIVPPGVGEVFVHKHRVGLQCIMTFVIVVIA